MPDGWTLFAAANRWVLYGSMSVAAGSALYLMAQRPPAEIGAVARRWGGVAAAIAAASYLLAIGFGGAAMLGGGPATLFSTEAWRLGSNTSLKLGALIGVPAMAVLIYAFRVRTGVGLGVGAAAAIASFLVTGHAATASPVWLTAPMVGLHLLCVAFWLGALAPLTAAARLSPREAGALMTRFSAQAIYAVGALILTGIVIGVVQVVHVAALTETAYGEFLALKGALVAVIVGLAAFNKFVLTPRLVRGESAGCGQIRRAIMLELLLYGLILAAAAALTTVAPPRTLD